MAITVQDLVRERYQSWEDLEFLVLRGGGTSAEVDRLGALYLEALRDLSRLRREAPRDPATGYLESLCVRAHAAVHRGRRRGLPSLVGLFVVEAPAAVRALWLEIVLAATVFLAALAYGVHVGSERPGFARQFVPRPLIGRIDRMAAERDRGQRPDWVRLSREARPLAGAAVWVRNLRVCLLAFAGGLLLGLPTLSLLMVNGVHLGLSLGLCREAGVAEPLMLFIAAHGPLELSLFVLAGAAGLRLGRTILGLADPRAPRLWQQARTSFLVMVGAGLGLIVAGAIEGLVSPRTDLGLMARLAVGLTAAVGFWLFAIIGGRGAPAAPHA